MEEQEARKLLVECGNELLDRGLVARTWGNISCRIDDGHMLITPSGLDYRKMTTGDIVKMDIVTMEWQGAHKPSSEKGVHAAAYQVYANAGFVIHTHQEYATALGIAGADKMDISAQENKMLGGTAVAAYGLSGTKKLSKAVKSGFSSGAEVVFMVHHGVVIVGSSKDETIEKALLLDRICRRNCKAELKTETADGSFDKEKTLSVLRSVYPFSALAQTPAVLRASYENRPVYAQVDDMAQMIGRVMPVSSGRDAKEIIEALEKSNVVLVKGAGAAVRAENADDCEALQILAEKAALCHLHTEALHVEKKCRIGYFDAALQHYIYVKKYSKQKK